MDLNNGITIIGGGIGGLAMANALQKAGFAFDLYEQAPELTEAGAGIGLSKAALDILDRIDLGTDVRDQGVSIKNVYLADKQLKVRRKLAVRLETVCIHRTLLEYAPAALLEKQENKLNDLTYLEEIHENELEYTTTK